MPKTFRLYLKYIQIFKIYLFERECAHMHTSGRGRERDSDSAECTLTWGLISRSWYDHLAETKSQRPNQNA